MNKISEKFCIMGASKNPDLVKMSQLAWTKSEILYFVRKERSRGWKSSTTKQHLQFLKNRRRNQWWGGNLRVLKKLLFNRQKKIESLMIKKKNTNRKKISHREYNNKHFLWRIWKQKKVFEKIELMTRLSSCRSGAGRNENCQSNCWRTFEWSWWMMTRSVVPSLLAFETLHDFTKYLKLFAWF